MTLQPNSPMEGRTRQRAATGAGTLDLDCPSRPRRRFLQVLGTAGVLGLGGIPASAAADSSPWDRQVKLFARDGDTGDNFGFSVALAGAGITALVGAFNDDHPNGDRAGSAYVFTGGHQTKLAASDGDAGDRFGTSVALADDGATALVGAFEDDDKGNFAGSAYVLTRAADGTWTEQQKLTASDGDAADNFGWAVALAGDGDTALVGAFRDEDPNAGGSAYVFTRTGSTWTEQQKLAAGEGDFGDRFGTSVALARDGNTALVGAFGDDDGGGNVGATYVFTRSGDTWTEQQKLAASDGDGGDFFGVSVALASDGDTALVGARGDDGPNGSNAGSAYVFTRSGDTWVEQQKLTASDRDAGDIFGQSVALDGDGDTALVGAPHDEDPNGDFAGSAYVFTRSAGTWTEQRKLIARDGDGSDRFGVTVALAGDGNTALVGASDDEHPNGGDAGSAYLFRR